MSRLLRQQRRAYLEPIPTTHLQVLRLKPIQAIRTASALALWITSTLAAAQSPPSQLQGQRWDLMPVLQPLLSYLRCEEVPLDPFGQAEKPMEALSYLVDQTLASNGATEDSFPKNDTPPRLSIQVWPGIEAQIHVLAGYGFFGFQQFYSANNKPALLRSLETDGWHLKRSPPNRSASGSAAMALVPVYRASKTMGNVHRELTLMEAQVDETTGEIELDGLTVMCGYGRRKP